MKNRFAGVTGALLFAAIATQAQASAAWVAKGEYLCSVAEVSSFDEDKAGIIEAGLRKSYLITVDSKRVYVTELDSERKSSQDIYTIVQRQLGPLCGHSSIFFRRLLPREAVIQG